VIVALHGKLVTTQKQCKMACQHEQQWVCRARQCRRESVLRCHPCLPSSASIKCPNTNHCHFFRCEYRVLTEAEHKLWRDHTVADTFGLINAAMPEPLPRCKPARATGLLQAGVGKEQRSQVQAGSCNIFLEPGTSRPSKIWSRQEDNEQQPHIYMLNLQVLG
jgi:hypothetical protein